MTKGNSTALAIRQAQPLSVTERPKTPSPTLQAAQPLWDAGLSQVQVAKAVGVSPQRINQLVQTGRLRVRQVQEEVEQAPEAPFVQWILRGFGAGIQGERP